MLNSRDISLLRPDVAANCRIWQARCKKAGLNVLITGTVRDEEYQVYCYENGYSQVKVPTFHSIKAGLAFDFCKNVKGQEYSDLAFFDKVAALAEEMGFDWGGRWKSFPDRPHIQWSNGGKFTGSMIRAGKYPPNMPLFEEEIEVSKEEIQAMVDAGVKEAVADAVKAAQPTAYTSIAEVPEWARPLVERAMAAKVLAGERAGKLHLTTDNLVNLQMLDNLGLIKA